MGLVKKLSTLYAYALIQIFPDPREGFANSHDTFGPSGSLDEGVGYWSYGFSYYAMAAERL